MPEVASQPNQPQVINKPGFNWKSVLIAVFIGAAVIVVAVVGLSYYINQNQSSLETGSVTIKTATPSAKTATSSAVKNLVVDLESKVIKAIPNDVNYKDDGVSSQTCYSWVIEDGSYISLKGYALLITSNSGDKFTDAFTNISEKTVKEYFENKGFVYSSVNSSINNFDLRHCGDAPPVDQEIGYSKGGIFCEEWFWKKYTVSFSCGEQDKDKDAQRKEFESAVYQALGKKTYFTVDKILDNYALIGPADPPQGLILKKDNGNWVKVGEGGYMQDPLCSYLASRNIPRKLFGGCFDSNGQVVKS